MFFDAIVLVGVICLYGVVLECADGTTCALLGAFPCDEFGEILVEPDYLVTLLASGQLFFGVYLDHCSVGYLRNQPDDEAFHTMEP